jgi:protoheme IX farnesyltransferase
LLAASLRHDYSAIRFLSVLLGTSLIIACGCAINNVLDRPIDAKMTRTRQRGLVTGVISPRRAITAGSIVGLAGFLVLLIHVNKITVLVGAAGLFFYVVVYSWFKRHSWLSTLAGSVSGAAPPVAGYTAVTGRLDGAAVILFLILVFWQMPHFYSIGIYRLKEYKAAGLPILPAVKGLRRTKQEILIYTVLFTAAAISLSVFGYTGWTYAAVAATVGLFWLRQGLLGFKAADDNAWARRMFGYSLIILLLLSVAISAGTILP